MTLTCLCLAGESAGVRLLANCEELLVLAGRVEEEVEQGGLPLPRLPDGGHHQSLVPRQPNHPNLSVSRDYVNFTRHQAIFGISMFSLKGLAQHIKIIYRRGSARLHKCYQNNARLL